jgi:ACS family hexuronate transporter-like MFS transporter
VFFVTGALGFIWAAAWLILYNVPARHKLVTDAERDYVETALSMAHGAVPRVPWIGLFRFRQIWGLVTARFLSDSAWFFLIFWLPKYLGDVRHLNIKQIGYYAWIPYVGAGTGSMLGGWFSSYLMRRKLSIDASRKIALGVGAACMPASLLIASSPLALAVVFFSMAMFGHQFWSAIVQTLAADMFPSQMVGSVSGMLGAAGSFGAMLFNLLVGALLTWHKSYTAILAISGFLHPLSFVIILLVVRRIEPVIRVQASVGHARA